MSALVAVSGITNERQQNCRAVASSIWPLQGSQGWAIGMQLKLTIARVLGEPLPTRLLEWRRGEGITRLCVLFVGDTRLEAGTKVRETR